jgi:peroxiredoxin
MKFLPFAALPLYLVAAFSAPGFAAGLDAGTLLIYQGELVADEDETAKKTLEYQVLVAGPGEKGTKLLWVVAEKGQGSASWIDQFGMAEADEQGHVLAGAPAAVLYAHADGFSPVPLVTPLSAGPKNFGNGVKWRDGNLDYEVTSPADAELAAGHWQIDVRSPIGHKRTVIVPKDRPLATEVSELVFMGPGKKHHLRLALAEEKQLTNEQLAQAQNSFDALLALREELKHEPLRPKPTWSKEQQALLQERLPAIVEGASVTPLAALTLRAAGDAKLQAGIAAAIAKLADKFVGQPAPALELKSASLSGEPLSLAKLKGKVVVLHFWTYRDAPLIEPYGQIGYLDFLHRQWKDKPVAVYGIACDERLTRDETRSDAVRSVRRLQAFMNVGYPIALADAETLTKFGDPMRLGAELPLTVIVDRDGKIAHYHLGLYEVDRDRGLAEVDRAVDEQLQ